MKRTERYTQTKTGMDYRDFEDNFIVMEFRKKYLIHTSDGSDGLVAVYLFMDSSSRVKDAIEARIDFQPSNIKLPKELSNALERNNFVRIS